MKKILFVILLLGLNVSAQQKFELKNLSKNYNLRITVEKCGDDYCRGKAKFSILRKNAKRPFQIIDLDDTRLSLNQNDQPTTAKIKDKSRGIWSDVYVEDFNFDGLEDLALADGDNGGYRATSYKIYLYSSSGKRFVYSSAFTKLVQGPYIGIFEIDKKRKTLKTISKSGCCMHYTEEYRLIQNRPKKIKEVNEYYNLGNDGMIETETRILINGKWQTRNKKRRMKK